MKKQKKVKDITRGKITFMGMGEEMVDAIEKQMGAELSSKYGMSKVKKKEKK